MKTAPQQGRDSSLRCPRCLARIPPSELRWVCAPDCSLRPNGGIRDPVYGKTPAGPGDPAARSWRPCPERSCPHHLTAWTAASCGEPILQATHRLSDGTRHIVFFEPLNRPRPLSQTLQAHLSELEKGCAAHGADICPATPESWRSFHCRFAESGFGRAEFDGEPLQLALRRDGLLWRRLALHSWSWGASGDRRQPSGRDCRHSDGKSLIERLGAADDIVVALRLAELLDDPSGEVLSALRPFIAAVAGLKSSARLWLFQVDPEYALIRELGISARESRILRSANGPEAARRVNHAMGEALKHYLDDLDIFPAGSQIAFDYSYLVGGAMADRQGHGLRHWTERQIGPLP